VFLQWGRGIGILKAEINEKRGLMNRQLPSIFDYYDFRKYLEEYRSKRKEFDPGFTHTYICYRLGQKNSKSYFANVINGIKIVTPEFINRLIELLELNAEEGNYFRALVNYNQTYNQKEKEYYLEQIVKQNKADSRLITAQEYSLYKEWHHSVIRAILDIFDFKDDFKWLAEMVVPPITVPQARKSINLLQSLNLIRRNEKGFLKPTDKTVRTEDYVHDEIIKHYQARCMEIAKLTLLGNNDQPKDYSTNILSVSEEGLKKIQQKTLKFREEIRALVQNDKLPADRVYHLDVQLFPNSRLLKVSGHSDPGAHNENKKNA
jgi:uncharacterized protein (TIGR02147 family)